MRSFKDDAKPRLNRDETEFVSVKTETNGDTDATNCGDYSFQTYYVKHEAEVESKMVKSEDTDPLRQEQRVEPKKEESSGAKIKTEVEFGADSEPVCRLESAYIKQDQEENIDCMNVKQEFNISEETSASASACENVSSGIKSASFCDTSKKDFTINCGKEKFECYICKTKFTHNCRLTKHMQTHTGQKPFECDLCDAKFTSRYHLKTHMMIHTGEKPFKCNFCDGKFIVRSHLKSHMRVHTGERPFKCNLCDLKFAHVTSLKRHVSAIHAREKLYTCDLCDSKFGRRGHLERHMSVHTGEKPFECSVCNSKFGQSYSLRMHSKLHTREGLFGCNLCGAEYTQNKALQRHLKIHTSAQPFM